MDAVKFLKERKRMCEAYKGCTGCPMEGQLCGGYISVDAERVVGAVEEWSAAHPRKTRQSAFLEQYPQAEIDQRGCLMLCPRRISVEYRVRYGNCINRSCSDCRREFWPQEVE